MLNNSPIILKLEKVNLYSSLLAKGKRNQLGYPILQDISFQAILGERLAIVGSTGAGKTSLLRLLNRLDEPTNGKIYFDNLEYHQIPIIELRKSVTFLPQEAKLLGMKVKQVLAYPLVLRGFNKQKIRPILDEWTEKLQIPNDWLEKTELQLSAGQRQIVAIARALLIQPKLLLLDEPTSALDAGHANKLMEILVTMSQDSKTTILMVNHQLTLAKKFCTKLIHLQQGKILADLAASEVNWENLQESLLKAAEEDDFGF